MTSGAIDADDETQKEAERAAYLKKMFEELENHVEEILKVEFTLNKEGRIAIENLVTLTNEVITTQKLQATQADISKEEGILKNLVASLKEESQIVLKQSTDQCFAEKFGQFFERFETAITSSKTVGSSTAILDRLKKIEDTMDDFKEKQNSMLINDGLQSTEVREMRKELKVPLLSMQKEIEALKIPLQTLVNNSTSR